MYKLNNVVVNAKKVKVGKDAYDCETNTKGTVFCARMTESHKDVKIVFDEYNITKTDFGFNITLISDAIDVVTFNKTTQIIKHLNMLNDLRAYRMCFNEYPSKLKNKFAKEYIDFASALEQSDYVIVYSDDAVENFVRRYVAIMKPAICEQAPVVIDRIPELLTPYLDKLDIVEKVMNETSPANLAYQLENKTFDANIDINILPLKTLQKCTKAGFREDRIKQLEDYIRSGKGSIEEVELMFKWCTAIKKLYEKTTGYNASTYSACYLVDLLQYGYTITEIMTKVSNDLMIKSSIVQTTGCDLLEKWAEIMDYRKVNNNQNKDIPENILVEHERTYSMYNVECRYVGTHFANTAHALNCKYSDIIDDMAFICPDHIRDFQKYSDRVNQLSIKTLNDFLDGKIMIFAIGNQNGQIYEAPIFYFDEDGNIIMIRDTLNDKQMNAAQKLWNKIQNKKGN